MSLVADRGRPDLVANSAAASTGFTVGHAATPTFCSSFESELFTVGRVPGDRPVGFLLGRKGAARE